MAAIDKIYTTYVDYLKFKDWCIKQPPIADKYGKLVKLSSYLFKYDEPFENVRPIFSAPYYLDAYVIRNCPFDTIQEELMLNYGHWSQERIKSYYEEVKNWNGEGECPYWAKPEDFIILEDGTMTIKGLEKSDYEKIKNGELYVSPKIEYEYGKHFRCIKHPYPKYNTPFKCKRYFVSVKPPTNYMWYHVKSNTWDFSEEFVESDWSSSCAHVKTIKALKRLLIKWKLPIGTVVSAEGRYLFDDYKFIITK